MTSLISKLESQVSLSKLSSISRVISTVNGKDSSQVFDPFLVSFIRSLPKGELVMAQKPVKTFKLKIEFEITSKTEKKSSLKRIALMILTALIKVAVWYFTH